MISLESIEAALEQLADGTAVEEAMVEFASEQPAFVQYLGHETFELLTSDERDYLQYLALVVYAAVKREGAPVPHLKGEAIERWEEQCFTWLEASVGRPMQERLNIFFETIDQEELLAFAEDSLIDPDQTEAPADAEEAALFTSGPSRELGLVALAALVGALDEAIA